MDLVPKIMKATYDIAGFSDVLRIVWKVATDALLSIGNLTESGHSW